MRGRSGFSRDFFPANLPILCTPSSSRSLLPADMAGVSDCRTDPDAARLELGLLERFSALVLCSGCLRHGRRTSVPQVISPRHRPRTLCRDCRETGSGVALPVVTRLRPIRTVPR